MERNRAEVSICGTNYVLSGEKSEEKIDGAIATNMGLDRAIRCGLDTGESVYDTRGLLVLRCLFNWRKDIWVF